MAVFYFLIPVISCSAPSLFGVCPPFPRAVFSKSSRVHPGVIILRSAQQKPYHLKSLLLLFRPRSQFFFSLKSLLFVLTSVVVSGVSPYFTFFLFEISRTHFRFDLSRFSFCCELGRRTFHLDFGCSWLFFDLVAVLSQYVRRRLL